MKFLLRLFSALLALFVAFGASAQDNNDPSVVWKGEVKSVGDNRYELVLEGTVREGWHTYDLHSSYSSTYIDLSESVGITLEGEAYEVTPSKKVEADGEVHGEYYGTFVLGQKFSLAAASGEVKCKVIWMSCIGTQCGMPEEWNFAFKVGDAAAQAEIKAAENQDEAPAPAEIKASESQDEVPAQAEIKASESQDEAPAKPFDWALVLEAILWGFAALLTPCVFPMVPMTVSFFMKGSENKAAGRVKAFSYGMFIVALYTLPIAAIILITRFVGGEAVTADIFNWLATHWLPNLLFFVVFMIFAASFFGAFEITLPSALVNKSDQNADKGGLAGIFFMALTLVLVSFSCTGPIVGSVLIQSTSGEFWQPIVTMFAFSLAFALPFTLFALFPSLLKNLPKSGGWLNSVKVVLGFIEVALGFKFLSVADQTYHWGLLDREIYLAIWIVCFSLLGFYLLGKLRFAHDSEVKSLSVTRLGLAIAVFTFVVYMIPGMWGAPLSGLSGYLPPIHTQEFVMSQGAVSAPAAANQSVKYGEHLHLPHGLQGYFDLEEATAAAKREGKPIFVDITGHGCVNCREMEARVWSDERVLDILREKYVVVALYTDDKMSVPESEWITTETGDTFKTLGRINSYIARTRFGVNAQPNYVLLTADGEQLAPTRGYDLSVEGFIAFLEGGLSEFEKRK